MYQNTAIIMVNNKYYYIFKFIAYPESEYYLTDENIENYYNCLNDWCYKYCKYFIFQLEKCNKTNKLYFTGIIRLNKCKNIDKINSEKYEELMYFSKVNFIHYNMGGTKFKYTLDETNKIKEPWSNYKYIYKVTKKEINNKLVPWQINILDMCNNKDSIENGNKIDYIYINNILEESDNFIKYLNFNNYTIINVEDCMDICNYMSKNIESNSHIYIFNIINNEVFEDNINEFFESIKNGIEHFKYNHIVKNINNIHVIIITNKEPTDYYLINSKYNCYKISNNLDLINYNDTNINDEIEFKIQ